MKTTTLSLLVRILIIFGATLPVLAGDGFDPAAGRGFIHPSGAMQKAPSMAAQAPNIEQTFHFGATLNCSHCHVMHATKQHADDNQGEPDPFGAFPQTFAQSKNMLKATNVTALCLSCHNDFPGIPDVVGADVNGLTERSAGFFEMPGVANPRGHKLDYSIDPNPDDWELCYRCHFIGEFQTAAVTCIDCHNPHGNGKARNLQWASWPGGEPTFGMFTNPAAVGMAKYEAANVGYGTSNSELNREVTNMCIDCHHSMSGSTYNDPDGNGFHNLHPTYESERDDPNVISQGQGRTSSAPAHWNAGTGAGFQFTDRVPFVTTDATDFVSSHVVDATKNGVFCLSCHKAHGGNRAYGLNWNPVSGIAGDGCDQCHAKTEEGLP